MNLSIYLNELTEINVLNWKKKKGKKNTARFENNAF